MGPMFRLNEWPNKAWYNSSNKKKNIITDSELLDYTEQWIGGSGYHDNNSSHYS